MGFRRTFMQLGYPRKSGIPDPAVLLRAEDALGSMRISDELRRSLEARTEDVLYRLYVDVAAALVVAFARLREIGDRDLDILGRIADSLSLAAPPKPATSADALDAMAWEPVARSSVLFLLEWLARRSAANETGNWGFADWSRGTFQSLDVEAFVARTAIPASDIPLALGVAARATIASEVFRPREFVLFQRTPMLLETDATAGTISVTALDRLPFGFFDFGHTGVTVMHEEAAVPEDGVSFTPAFDDGTLVRDGDLVRLAVGRADDRLLVIDLLIDGPFQEDWENGVLRIQPSSKEPVALRFGESVRATAAAGGLVLQADSADN